MDAIETQVKQNGHGKYVKATCGAINLNSDYWGHRSEELNHEAAARAMREKLGYGDHKMVGARTKKGMAWVPFRDSVYVE